MRNGSLLFGASLLIGLVSACTPEQRNYGNQGGAGGMGGGGMGGGGGEPSAIDMACQTYAQNLCAQASTCSPAVIARMFGDLQTCVARYDIFCHAALTAVGTSWTPDTISACSSAYAGMDCNFFLAMPFRNADEFLPEACAPQPGALPDGSACYDKAQCQSGNCHHATGAFCGICGPRGTIGDMCTSTEDCQAHQICWSGKCTAAGEVGDACDIAAGMPCAAPWPCFGGICSKPAQLGEICGGNGPDCGVLQGLNCNPQTYHCDAIQYAESGAACAPMDPVPTQCGSGGVCKGGMCVAPALDGAPCDPAVGPICMAPAACINGKCMVPDPAACQ